MSTILASTRQASAAIAWCAGLTLLVGCAPRAERPPEFEPDSLADAYRSPTGALMLPGATRAWQVTAQGNLYNGAWRMRVVPASGPDSATLPRRIAAEDRWLPVLHWTRRSGAVRWDFCAVARPTPRDSCLLVSLEVAARNLGSAPAPARLELALDSREPGAGWVAWDADDETPRWGGGRSQTRVNAWAAGATNPAADTMSWTLAPGERRALRILLPAYPTAEGDLARAAERSHAEWAEESRRYWHGALERGARFELGDPEVENALRAAAVVLLSCRERRGDRWVPIGGPFQYRDVWLRDGARAIAALAVAGFTDEARQLADGLLLFQWPEGAFLSQRGQLDGTGQALWAIEQAELRPAPGRDVGRFADAARSACRWIELQRDLGSQIGGAYPRMLPFADPRDGELTRAQLLGNDAWAIAAEHAAARLLSAAGRAAQAESLAAAEHAYRADFAASLARSGRPDLPPSWQGPGRDWGAFAAAWPCGALAPSDPRAAAFATRVWRAAGGAGLTFYGAPDSLHGYLGADLGVWAMRVGRRAEADSVIDAHLRWRTASGTASELFGRDSRDFGTNPPPHPTAAAALWFLVRNAMIYDDEDTLRLTLGCRERWWRGARVTRAPTRWGSMDLACSHDAGHARWSWTAVPVWSALTLPPRTSLATAPAPPLLGEPGGTVVWAPPRTTRAEVELREERTP